MQTTRFIDSLSNLVPASVLQNAAQLSGMRRLSALIAAITLLSACTTVEGPVEAVVVDDEDVSVESTRIIGNRSTGALVSIEPDAPVETNQQVFDSVWDRITSGLEFSFAHDNERIDAQIAFYKENADFLAVVSERASPFLFEIVEELDKRGMPLELALLPVIESAYNPNAAGAGNTVGLWQIVAATGRSLGLKQDWWYDGRRDPTASTTAALDYLETLHEMFDGDWLLALAAYNSGQGTVQNAIDENLRRSRATDYWSLNLPPVTEEYIPRVIALGRLFAEPEQNGLELVDIPNERVVVPIEVGAQIDLSLAAEIAGVEPETLYQLNPGFRQWATHPDGPHTLLLPITHAENFTVALAGLGDQSRVTWDRYVVQPGDTLGQIARQFRTQVAALQQANDLEGSRIVAGESLLIPRAYTSGNPLQTPNAPQYVPGAASSGDVALSQPAPVRYEVRSGDSLWRIANRYNLTINALAQRNNIDANSVLRPGQMLILAADSTLAQTSRDTNDAVSYQVRAGDSLARIARQFGVGVAELARWNDIAEEDLIHPGQQLVLRPGESELN